MTFIQLLLSIYYAVLMVASNIEDREANCGTWHFSSKCSTHVREEKCSYEVDLKKDAH